MRKVMVYYLSFSRRHSPKFSRLLLSHITDCPFPFNTVFTVFFRNALELHLTFGFHFKLNIKDMTLKKTMAATLVLGLVATGSVGAYNKFRSKEFSLTNQPKNSLFENAKYSENSASDPMVDFEKAATKASPAVVHIKTLMKATQGGNMSQVPEQF